MILKLYSVYDIKSKIYQPPFYCHNGAHAMRMFTQIFGKEGTTFAAFPEDFQVWELGSYDDQTAGIAMLKNPTLLCTARDLIGEAHPQLKQMEEEVPKIG